MPRTYEEMLDFECDRLREVIIKAIEFGSGGCDEMEPEDVVTGMLAILEEWEG